MLKNLKLLGTIILIFILVGCGSKKCNVLWCFNAEDSIASIIQSDIDDDGLTEVVVSDSKNIYLLRGWDGSKIWSSEGGGFLALGDINDDGELEIFSIGGGLFVLNGRNGSYLWDFLIDGWSLDIALGDLNNDSKLEAIISSSGDNIAKSGLYVLDAQNGSLRWNFNPAPGFYTLEAIGDLDKNGITDILLNFTKYVRIPQIFPPLLNKENIRVFENTDNYEDGLYALKGDDGSVLWYSNSMDSVSLGDINGDNIPDVLSGFFALDGKNGTLLWQTSIPKGYSFSCFPPSIGDVNKDGSPDVILTCRTHGTTDNIGSADVIAVNGIDGIWLWRYTIEGDYFLTSSSIGDVDGDNKLEVVFGAHILYTPKGDKIIILNGEDGSLQSFYELTGDFTSPVLGDVDGDGTIDILVGSTDKTVYAISTGAPMPVSKDMLPWPMEKHDPYRTGNYNFVP